MAEFASVVLGIAATPYALLQAVLALRDHIHHIRHNAQLKLRLQILTRQLITTLESVETVSPDASAHTHQELQSLLQSLQHRRRSNRIVECVLASDDHSKLKEAERKLENLQTQVVVVGNMLQLRSTVCNEFVELPPFVNRSATILNFLQTSQTQDFRVIAIHGQPGVGKTTLLNYVWQEASSKALFAARAYVQVGDRLTKEAMCNLQSSLVWQLVGQKRTFPSNDMGKEGMRKCFQELKASRRPLFLVLDNVVDSWDLRDLLPTRLTAHDLPTSSCIAITCRDHYVVEALLRIFHLQEDNVSQVFCFQPPCFDLNESTRVFAECAGMEHSTLDQHRELLDNLVPPCGGLPLALTVIGNLFVDKVRRERAEWQLIQQQLSGLNADNEDTSLVTRSLRLSYDRLAPSRRAAFLDIASMFYGWPWKKVEMIVGVLVMRDLKSSALITQVDGIEMCNQSALGRGYDSDSLYNTSPMEEYLEKVVTMHDLTLRFGMSILTDDTHHVRDDIPTDYIFFSKARRLRNLTVSSCRRFRFNVPPIGNASDTLHCRFESSMLEFVKKATNLQMLSLNFDSQDFHHATFDEKYAPLEARELYHLSLINCDLSRSIMEMKVSREIRAITLGNCGDIVELPDTPLHHLETLRICNCPRFQGFSVACVREWHNLKDLMLDSCQNVTSIPDELGSLPKLRAVFVGWCDGLQQFPSLRSPHGPSTLVLKHCSRLINSLTISCPLRALRIQCVPIDRLELADVTLLTHLIITGCANLLELPPTIEQASSLTWLDVSGCENMKELPLAIANCTALERLHIEKCSGMTNTSTQQKLESLRGFLKELHLSCNLPRAGMSRQPQPLVRLQVLHISSYKAAMVDLREEVVGSLASLRELVIRDCEQLKEIKLPVGVGWMWASLRKLAIVSCSSIEELPDAICSCLTLEKLEVKDCERLMQLPSHVGQLSNLKELDLRGCCKLKELPSSLGNAGSLEELTLIGCESLETVPQKLVEPTTLCHLDMRGCKGLQMPDHSNRLSLQRSGSSEGLKKMPQLDTFKMYDK